MQNNLLNQKVKDNMPLVKMMARKYATLYNQSFDDMLSCCLLGCYKAYVSYNGTSSIKYHVCRYIKSEIMHFMRDDASLIKYRNDNLTDDEKRNLYNITSLDVPCNDENNGCMIDILASDKSIICNVDIERAMSILDKQEYDIINKLYLQGYKQSEIARFYNTYEMRIERIHRKAINKMRNYLQAV